MEGDSTAAGSNASAWKPVEAGAPPQQDSTMLPHAIARRKEQAPPPHMAAWLPQGFMLGLLHAHMTQRLPAFPVACGRSTLSSARKLGSKPRTRGLTTF